MKKTLIVLLTAVLAMSMLFVSCSNESKIDSSPVEVSFDVAQGRGLTSSIETHEVEDLYWYYKATRTTGSSGEKFNYGEHTSWYSLGKGLSKIITLSQGKWDFSLQARKTQAKDGIVVYEGSVSGVLVLRNENNTVNQISVPVSQLTSGTGTILISKDIKVNKTTLSVINTYTPTHVKYKSINSNTWSRDIPLSTETVEGVTSLCDTSLGGLVAGAYDVVVMYKGSEKVDGKDVDIVFASAEITVTVYGNTTTTISGSINGITTSNQFTTQIEGLASTTDISNADKSTSVSVSVPLSPQGEIRKDTNVTFDAGTLPSNASNVNIEVKTVEEAQTGNFIGVGNNNAVVAAIDLKITDNLGKELSVISGDDKKVTVTTYIMKNLSNVVVKYNGDGVQPDRIAIITPESTEEQTSNYYESDTGKLVFTTTHFSEFFVESNAVCYSEKNNKGYLSLVDAAAESSSTDTIHILCDIDLSSFVDDDNDGCVIARLDGKLDGSKGNNECYTIKMPVSDSIDYFIGKHGSLTVSNINIVLGNRDSIISLMSNYSPSNARVKIDNVDYSSSVEDHSYAIGHNSSVYGSYFTYGGDVEFKNCDVVLNLDGLRSEDNSNSAVFYGGYHFGNPTISVIDCSYSGVYTGAYVALVISNGQGITAKNTNISGLINNGELFGLKDANAVGAQNTKTIEGLTVTGSGTITKAPESNIEIATENNLVTFTASSNNKARSYILQLAGVRKIFNASGVEFASNYNYDIRFTDVAPNSPTPLYKMIDIDTAKKDYGFADEDFAGVTWKKTGSAYDGDGEYCVAAKNGTSYYVLRFTSTNGYSYSIDTIPSQINVMVLDESGKLIEIKSK